MEREYITVSEVQELILPASKKIIRRIINDSTDVRVLRIGRRILVNRNDFLKSIEKPDEVKTKPVIKESLANNNIYSRSLGLAIDWNK